MKNILYTFDDDLRASLKDPVFRQAWEASAAEYLLAKQVIEKRLAQKLSQRDLAKKLKTSQAAISRIEAMNANPSLNFLKRLATALNTPLTLTITPSTKTPL
jgi:ribosome-binding protein aMBF1 (putative translation factor)